MVGVLHEDRLREMSTAASGVLCTIVVISELIAVLDLADESIPGG